MDSQSKFKHLSRLMLENDIRNTSTNTVKDTTTTTTEINNNKIQPPSTDDKSTTKKIRDKLKKKRVFIENVQYEVHENLLEHFFSKYGKIKRAKIIRDSLTNKSKGIGYIEFENETDAEKLIKEANDNPVSLMLRERQMIVQPYKERQQRKHSRKAIIQDNDFEIRFISNNNSETTTNVEKKINDLPVDVLTNILSRLCLRDLCIAEQVCKKWYNAAHVVWSVKKKLILNNHNILENYVCKKESQYGFTWKPKFDVKALRQIIKKSSGKSLKHLDLSSSASTLGHLDLSIMTEHYPNITHLNISKLNISNQSFKSVRSLKYLKELKMAYCSQISDLALMKLFYNCENLETIDLTFCHTLTGKCFVKNCKNLKSVIIDQCDNIIDDNIQRLFEQNKQLERFSIRRNNKSLNSATLLYILKNSKNLKELVLADHGFDCLLNIPIDLVQFERLENLVKLDLTNCRISNEYIAKLLNTSTTIKSLNLSYCSGLNDNLFYGLSINSPLEELNLSFVNNITDLTLDSLFQLGSSLKSLRLKGNSHLTNDKLIELMKHLSSLSHLDVRNISNVNNTLLETALKLDTRKITINCSDTSVNTIEFDFNHKDLVTTKTFVDTNYYQYKCKNLTFDTNLSKLKSKEKDAEWRNEMLYVGSPIGSDYDEDDDSFESFDFNENNGFFDQPAEDDLDFLEEKQEMFDEIGQFH